MLTVVLLFAASSALAANPPKPAPAAKPAQPTAAEKLLNDVDRKAQEIYAAADKDKNGELSEAEKVDLIGEASAAATKLAKARKITEPALKKFAELIASQPVKFAATKTTTKIKAPTAEVTEFVNEFRGNVKTAAETLIDQEAAEKDAALARKQAPPEEPLVQGPPNAGQFQPTTRRYERDNDDWEERRLRDRARQAEWEARQLRRDLDRERAAGYATRTRTNTQPQPAPQPARSNPTRPGQTLREKIGYDKDRKK
jgi:hypothetical protein